jgi:hypothetical protein
LDISETTRQRAEALTPHRGECPSLWQMRAEDQL